MQRSINMANSWLWLLLNNEPRLDSTNDQAAVYNGIGSITSHDLSITFDFKNNSSVIESWSTIYLATSINVTITSKSLSILSIVEYERFYVVSISLLHMWGFPDSKVHRVNMGPTWGRQDQGGPMLAHEPCYLGFHSRQGCATKWNSIAIVSEQRINETEDL